MGQPESTSPEPTGPDPGEAQAPDTTGKGAFWVASGILLSRTVGLIRERVFAYYFGNAAAAAAFKAAFRIPNLLQNLFGEGVLSASFIPVYARLVGEGDREEADRVAGAVFGLLSLVTAAVVALGVLFAPQLVSAIAPGFAGETRVLTIQLVRIFFPACGLLALSAWCLGILNSHRKFFVSYAAPVIWSCAQIAALAYFGGRNSQQKLAEYVAYAVVAGSCLQFAIQLPSVMRLLGRFLPSLSTARASVRSVLRNFVPVLFGRGVVQVSAFIDTAYASLISERAVSALSYAQTIYLVPVSLFGMAVSAAELPVMSQAAGSPEEIATQLRARVNDGLGRIAFFVVPSAAAFLFLGDVVGAALLQTGRFRAGDSRYLWYLLIGSTVGLLAATLGRLYASAFYALRDPRTPLVYATLRVVLTAVLAYWSAVKLPAQLGIPRELGAVGITATTGLAAWIEFLLLRRALAKRIGVTGIPGRRLAGLWGSAALAAGLALAIKIALVHFFGRAAMSAEWESGFLPPPALGPIVVAVLVLAPFGAAYLLLTAALGAPQSRALLHRAGIGR